MQIWQIQFLLIYDMATKKKDNYIVYELEFLEKKAEELKQYVEANPFDKLKDRIHWKETKSG